MVLGIEFQILGPSTLISLNPLKLVLLDLVEFLMSVKLDLVGGGGGGGGGEKPEGPLALQPTTENRKISGESRLRHL